MNTIALTEETAPRTLHSRVLFVVKGSQPQSSAFTIRRPAGGMSPFWRADWLAGEAPTDDTMPEVAKRLPDRTKRPLILLFIALLVLPEVHLQRHSAQHLGLTSG
jgi:hypothetical protein